MTSHPVLPDDGPGSTPTREPTTWHRLKFLLTPRWVVLACVVVLFTLSCYFFLAPWQFARSQQHDGLQREIAEALAAGPAPIADVLSVETAPPNSVVWRQVTATGKFEPHSQAYVRLRQDNAGQPAYEVVVGFVTDSGQRVLVDRGYYPFAAIQAGSSPAPVPAGTVTISGRVQQDQTDPRHRPPSAMPDGTTAYNAVSSSILEVSDGSAGAPLYRGYVQLAEGEPGVLDAISLPVDNSRPFYSYAIQWLSFGAIAVLGFLYFVYREYQEPTGDQIYVAVDADAAARATSSNHDGRSAASQPASTDITSPTRNATTTASTSLGPPHEASRRKAKFDKSQLYDA